MPQNKSCRAVKQGYRVLGKSFNDSSCLQNSLPTWLSPSLALRQCCQLAVVHGTWKKMTGSFNYLSCRMISDKKIEDKWFNNIKLRWCVPFSACCYSADRRAHPSACPVRLVCHISLCGSDDRHAHSSACLIWLVFHISLHCFSDRHACPSACPVRSVCHISLSHSSDRHAHPSAVWCKPMWGKK